MEKGDESQEREVEKGWEEMERMEIRDISKEL